MKERKKSFRTRESKNFLWYDGDEFSNKLFPERKKRAKKKLSRYKMKIKYLKIECTTTMSTKWHFISIFEDFLSDYIDSLGVVKNDKLFEIP